MDLTTSPAFKMHAAYTGDVGAVASALSTGGPDDDIVVDGDGRSPLAWAVCGGREDVVALLLSRPNAGASLRLVDGGGWLPMHSATACGHASIVQMLLHAGADANATTTEEGNTPLHYHKGRISILQLLLPRSTNVNACNAAGATALHRAAGPGHTEASRMLLAAGANVNAVDNRGSTPLHLACAEGEVSSSTSRVHAVAAVPRPSRPFICSR